MADTAVSFLVSDALWKLTSSSIRTYRLLHGLEDDVEALRITLEQIQAVLEDAEVKQRKEKAVETWLKSLRSASLELENVLDEVSIEAMQQRLLIQRGMIYRVRAFFSSIHNQLRFRIRIVQKVKDIRRRLDTIAATRSNFNLSHTTISVDVRVGGDRKSAETSSLVYLSDTYGRDAEKEMIIQQICNKHIVRHYADKVRVYAIWGMGGVGKTTLAQLVYNHEMVTTHFELKSWVYVSAEFEIDELTKGIIESIDGRRCKLSQLDKMQVHLQNRLHQKRFLIVLDDVWINDSRKWEEISKPLSCGAEGSIVMVTTRSQEISRMMARVPEFMHNVRCLSEEDSWSFFEKLAFGVGREGEDIRELEPIGKKIVEKCKGLPLAVKALGSLMWSKSSAIEWQRVKENDLWELQGDEVQILPALKLSYDALPTHMKRCFAYCCLFPNGHDMAMDLLIQLWVTNGFIPSDGMYTIGEQIFSCLCQRSFFEVDMVNLGYKMHDMMHKLARYVMRHDCSIITPGRELIIPDEVLHLSSSCQDFVLSDEDSEKLRSVRSIFIFAHEYKGKVSRIFEHKYLRVLHLIGIGGTTLPESIGKLKNLRYLNLSGSNINVLPESIIYLQNLQVLILYSCMELRKLPDNMRYLRNLQCLDIKCCYKLLCMPIGIKKSASLRRLTNFIVGEKDGARIGELENLNLLEGELEIQGLENVQGIGDARRANLSCKTNLTRLVLVWRNRMPLSASPVSLVSYVSSVSSEGVESILEELKPNSNLKELEIRDYPGERISPSWMMNLENLVRIRFSLCERCSHISALGKLPNLKVLHIQNMNLVRLHDENNTTSGDGILFPCLETLDISSCMNFVSLPRNLPKLKSLAIVYCPALRSLPDGLRLHDENNTTTGDGILFPCLETLYISNCMNFVSLPSNLPKLKSLTISYCPALRSLPDGLQSLRELHSLWISGCDDLVRRCEKETGEDWPKISHVPKIHLSSWEFGTWD